MEQIFTARAPKPAGHYSQAIVHDNLVYVSGQIVVDPKTQDKRVQTIEQQTEQALKNLKEVLYFELGEPLA